MKNKIYLAGPINGCTDAECKDWRERAKQVLGAERCLDPMARDYRGREDGCFDEIVQADKRDILRCHALLVNYTKPTVGTAMEMMFAYEHEIPSLVVVPEDAKLSPWVRYHSTKIVHSLEYALELLK